MRNFAIAGVAALAIAGSAAVYAQHYRPWFSHHHMRMNPGDRAALTDARIAAVHAGLKLNADQEKLWPPVEAAVRDFAKLQIDRANARMNDDRSGPDSRKADDPVTRLRDRAETMAANAAALKRIADTADPLYKTLDEGQKRRLALLTHMERRLGEGWRQNRFGMGRDNDRGDGGRDRFYQHDREDRPDRNGGGPEKL